MPRWDSMGDQDLKDYGYEAALLRNLQAIAEALQGAEIKVTVPPSLAPMRVEVTKPWSFAPITDDEDAWLRRIAGQIGEVK